MLKQTQQKQILDALIKNKEAGLNSYFITYNMRIKQGPTRVSELKEAGHIISSETLKDRSVQYRLAEFNKPQYEREGINWRWAFTDAGVAYRKKI